MLGLFCDTQKERPQTVASLFQGPDSVPLTDADSLCSLCHQENQWVFLKGSNCELGIIVLNWDHRTRPKARAGWEGPCRERSSVWMLSSPREESSPPFLAVPDYLHWQVDHGWMDRKIARGWFYAENDLHFLPACTLHYLFCIKTKARGYTM